MEFRAEETVNSNQFEFGNVTLLNNYYFWLIWSLTLTSFFKFHSYVFI